MVSFVGGGEEGIIPARFGWKRRGWATDLSREVRAIVWANMCCIVCCVVLCCVVLCCVVLCCIVVRVRERERERERKERERGLRD